MCLKTARGHVLLIEKVILSSSFLIIIYNSYYCQCAIFAILTDTSIINTCLNGVGFKWMRHAVLKTSRYNLSFVKISH